MYSIGNKKIQMMSTPLVASRRGHDAAGPVPRPMLFAASEAGEGHRSGLTLDM
jgi:hypothetical protein